MEYTKEQLKAAYALNLCTISVSQIIDYNDVNIMEQEYDAILNNLNLEQMPKDEALLKILKQTLDTITFFRISEKEKEYIEKGYQQKMKNAIWSAVPNLSMIVSGGSWVTAAIAIASQVGIGYMNYRRAKASGELDREKQLWELERAAIEQFNGLRRELFDTAWRLSAVYNYPDELRLTERQIKQYNSILMDNDPVRRYERLDSIKEYFIAYPPFWYYMGHTAVDISRADINISDEKRIVFRQEAVQHFKQFRATNQQGLLREDPVASSCALELIELLDPIRESQFISELIDEAYTFSGRKEDILQICAMDYLRIGETDKAVHILKQLLNEGYIPYMNAQLLSGIYVSAYVSDHSLDILDEYKLLQRRVGSEYLFPLPEGNKEKADLNLEFIEKQREVLEEKYKSAIDEINSLYAGRYAKIIPVKGHNADGHVDYYSLSKAETSDVFRQLKSVFDNSSTAEAYRKILREIDIKAAIVDLLNDLFGSVSELIFVNDIMQSNLANDIEKAIIVQRENLNALLNKLDKGKFVYEDMISLLRIEYADFTLAFLEDLLAGMDSYINSLSEMQDFAIAEQSLVEFCGNHGLQDPDVKYALSHTMSYDIITADRKFTCNLWEQKTEQFSEETKRKLNLLKTIEKYQGQIIIDPANAEFYSTKDPRTSRYFSSNGKLYNYKGLRQKTIAVLDAKGKNGGFDLIFTDEGVIPYRDDVVKKQVLYRDIRWNDKEHKELFLGEPYKGYVADLEAINNMVKELKKNCSVPTEQGVNIWDAFLGLVGIK